MKEAYNTAKAVAKRAVAKARHEAWQGWYEGNLITGENEIKERWREYFNTLLNVENEREPPIDYEPIEGPIQNVSEWEVKEAIEQIKKGKRQADLE